MKEHSNNPESFEDIDFGTRECLACHEEIGAPGFGRHVFAHSPQELTEKWPGGLRGVMDSLADSLTQSIEAAEGNPHVQKNLEKSFEAIQILREQLEIS
ncbi:MAG TPA: hypothetical protein VF996_02390 [Candidatus Saccharimonadales bacterium]